MGVGEPAHLVRIVGGQGVRNGEAELACDLELELLVHRVLDPLEGIDPEGVEAGEQPHQGAAGLFERGVAELGIEVVGDLAARRETPVPDRGDLGQIRFGPILETQPETVAAAYGLTSLQFGPDCIIPKPFDPRLMADVPCAVAKAAIDSGVATTPKARARATSGSRLSLHTDSAAPAMPSRCAWSTIASTSHSTAPMPWRSMSSAIRYR